MPKSIENERKEKKFVSEKIFLDIWRKAPIITLKYFI